MKLATVLATATLLFSAHAHASGAVSYSCAGYVPNDTGSGPKSQQSVVFSLTNWQGGTYINLEKMSQDTIDPAHAEIDLKGAGCKSSQEPDEKYPAYRVTISGVCSGVKVNIKGICFFDL